MFTPQELLRQLLPSMDAPVWWLGLSGGMDSMVLLEAIAELSREHSLPPLRAIHVHHGLHADADRWSEHCAREAAVRNIPLVLERVSLAAGASIEAQAREARYAAFARHMGANDCLLLAHHRDDQLETLLFRLMRGTGLRGLAGMPAQRALARGRLLRPLLDTPRSALRDWAEARQLAWIEDPANRDPRFARTALRHDLLPRLRQGWPAVDNSLLTLLDHAREANGLLDEVAAEDMQRLGAPVAGWLSGWPSLEVSGLMQLSEARRRNLLRHWLRQHGQALAQRRLLALEGQLAGADDAQPIVELERGRLHRSSGRLWLLREVDVLPPRSQTLACQGAVPLAAENGVFSLHLPAVEPASLGEWTLSYRTGGETLRLPGRPTQSLKHLLQEAGLPAWFRPRIPLLHHRGVLVSVAGRWNDSAYLDRQAGPGWALSWQPRGE